MSERMSRLEERLVSSNKQTLLSVFHEDQEIFARRFIRERLSFCFQDCFEELSDLIGVIKGSEIYCYACNEVVETVDRNAPTSVVTRDTTKHLESVHGIVQTVS
jgi:hypothetical protein